MDPTEAMLRRGWAVILIFSWLVDTVLLEFGLEWTQWTNAPLAVSLTIVLTKKCRRGLPPASAKASVVDESADRTVPLWHILLNTQVRAPNCGGLEVGYAKTESL
jgi:hypothetical protein